MSSGSGDGHRWLIAYRREGSMKNHIAGVRSFYKAFSWSPGLLYLVCSIGAQAEVRLATLFQDGMVLQREARVPVWGRADVGELVAVTFGGHEASAVADAEGRWRVYLPPLAMSTEPRELTVAGRTTRVIRDVLVGEVWLCSGQSNMAFPVRQALNAAEEMAAANYPRIRQFGAALTAAERPAESVKGKWIACQPSTVGQFTAVGYFFARAIHRELGVP